MNAILNGVAALSAALCLGFVAAPSAAQAQGLGISGEIGFGGRVRQEYFGAQDYTISPRGRGSVEAIQFGRTSRGEPGVDGEAEGFGIRGAFRLVAARSAEDFQELAGLSDIPFSVEIGMGVGYETEHARVFADLRYGAVGHGTFVGEVGGDLIYRPSATMVLSAGPRLFFGSDDYANTYFGITAAEAGASAFTAFDASGGLLSAGIEMRVDQRLNEDWSVQGELEFSRFLNDASRSPITQETDHAILSVTLARRFSFGF